MTDPEFREAYCRHKDVLYRFAWRMTGSPASAEDAVHDCFLILLRNPSGYNAARGTLRSFLIGVTRNLALKQLRGQSRFDEFDDENEDNAAPSLPDLDGGSRAGMIARAVASLPPLQREVLILAEYEEMTLEEISRVAGAELAAVKSRLHRARENMRRMLAPLLDQKGIASGTNR
jgi:RNA polymerase sigma factor (sigma-70 family)